MVPLVRTRLQAKRLEELEKLYREEQVARKRAFNAMEDLKVGSAKCWDAICCCANQRRPKSCLRSEAADTPSPISHHTHHALSHWLASQGKIRVFCRVRPILPFETEKGQAFGLNIPDELTVTHPWKDEKKHREYSFDQVFHPGCSQEQVFEDTRHLVQSAVDGYNVCIFAYGGWPARATVAAAVAVPQAV